VLSPSVGSAHPINDVEMSCRDVTAAWSGALPTMTAVRQPVPRAAVLHALFRNAGLDAATSGKPGTSIAILSVPTHPFIAPVEKYVGSDFADR
jgi:hypothetical protein